MEQVSHIPEAISLLANIVTIVGAISILFVYLDWKNRKAKIIVTPYPVINGQLEGRSQLIFYLECVNEGASVVGIKGAEVFLEYKDGQRIKLERTIFDSTEIFLDLKFSFLYKKYEKFNHKRFPFRTALNQGHLLQGFVSYNFQGNLDDICKVEFLIIDSLEGRHLQRPYPLNFLVNIDDLEIKLLYERIGLDN